MTAPSNANTSGLDVVGWIKRINERHPIGLTQPGDWRFTPHHPTLDEGLKAEWFDIEPLATAASAQARIAELEAENKSHRSGGWILAEMKRRQEAEARADRLAQQVLSLGGTPMA